MKYVQIEIQSRYSTTPKEFFVRADHFSSLPGWHGGFTFFLSPAPATVTKNHSEGGSLTPSGSATRTTLLVSLGLAWAVALEKQIVKMKETTTDRVGGKSQQERESNI